MRHRTPEEPQMLANTFQLSTSCMQTWPQDGDQPTPFENFAVEHVPKCQSVDRLVHFEVGSFGLMGAWSCQQIGRRQEQWPETNHTVKCRCVDSLYFSDDMVVLRFPQPACAYVPWVLT